MFSIFADTPVSTREWCGITTSKFTPDFNDLAWETLTHVVLNGPPPGRDETTQEIFKLTMRMARELELGTFYANPIYLVRAQRPTTLFIETSKSAQLNWFHQLKTVFHSRSQIEQVRMRTHPIIRQLAFTGLMVIENRHVWPGQWPKGEQARLRHDLTGQTFGRLTVVKMLPQEHCHCECECGNQTTVMRKHLAAGRTRSCGCLKQERQARLAERKRNRGWLMTGHLNV
jgi:hypothetical protein